MAVDTDLSLRNQVIYSIFVRNYSEEGTFAAVEGDLDRIAKLGVDIIWLMPIHPIGTANRKGSLGSPYAISDYRAISPEYGTMDDFISLVDAIHARGMKVIIDVVYNHTSPDSVLSKEHPEWFYHKPDGSFGNRVGDWWDVIDLDYANQDLWEYQIKTLLQWAQYVDGFRCDVAPKVPVAFWEEARAEVKKVRPDAVWLAESTEPAFTFANRARRLPCATDSELYAAFDLCYDYDIYEDFFGYLSGEGSLEAYAAAIQRQESIYPENYGKARFLENHDKSRAAALIPSQRALVNWTAFTYFQKGTTLLYAGQEVGATHQPSLFDKDTVSFVNEKDPEFDLSPLMARLHEIKSNAIFCDSMYEVAALPQDRLLAVHTERLSVDDSSAPKRAIGIFSLRGEGGPVDLRGHGIRDGIYTNEINGEPVEITWGRVITSGVPIVFFES